MIRLFTVPASHRSQRHKESGGTAKHMLARARTPGSHESPLLGQQRGSESGAASHRRASELVDLLPRNSDVPRCFARTQQTGRCHSDCALRQHAQRAQPSGVAIRKIKLDAFSRGWYKCPRLRHPTFQPRKHSGLESRFTRSPDFNWSPESAEVRSPRLAKLFQVPRGTGLHLFT